MSHNLDTSKIGAALAQAAIKSVSGSREDRSGRFASPKAFISYSHDSDKHKAWVLKLGSDLRAMGVDVVLDQWDLVPGQDVSLFMQREIAKANRVILVCSSTYVSKSEEGIGGVGYERMIVTGEVIRSIDTTKFIPILRGSDRAKKIPAFLGPRLYIDFGNDADYDTKLVELAREIHGAPAASKPILGLNPFSGKPDVIASASAHTAADPERKLLDSGWFNSQQSTAQTGIRNLGFEGQMELRVATSHPLAKSQIELLNSVRQSEIQTFGWPIGILLENRDEFRPRPYGDGIKAEVSIAGEPGGRKSYDYWSLRSNGDFFLLQSLFEDSRKPKEIFFDSRIIRVTESLMFIERLYTKLGVPPESKIEMRVSHAGFKGRALTSASPNRIVFPRTSLEGESSMELVTVLGNMHETRVEDVRRLLAPMFALFDYAQFNLEVFEDIVRSFEAGRIH
jgi:TIR domain